MAGYHPNARANPRPTMASMAREVALLATVNVKVAIDTLKFLSKISLGNTIESHYHDTVNHYFLGSIWASFCGSISTISSG